MNAGGYTWRFPGGAVSTESVSEAHQRDVLFDQLADALSERGYAVIPSALPGAVAESLLQRVASLGDQVFRPAGTGRQQSYQRDDLVRSDHIHWLAADDPSEVHYLAWMESLRAGLNRRLFLGLFDYECHFARYAPGSFYKKHVDAFRGRSNRVLSTVFYLNPEWTASDGGELVIYDEQDRVVGAVQPVMGTLVVFLSEKVPHEVLEASRLRHSVAGWFRVNASLGAHIDPPNAYKRRSTPKLFTLSIHSNKPEARAKR